jgi:hypothetical protein
MINRTSSSLLSAALAASIFLACGDDTSTNGGGNPGGGAPVGGQGGDGGTPSEPVVTVLHPDREPLPGETECVVTITDNLPFEGQTHVPVCTTVSYATNPPSSGNHWGVWAQFRVFDTPVPLEMLVHNLEHGAILMLYRCDEACPDIPAAFETAADAFGPDPICLMSPTGADRSRIVVTPAPTLTAPIGLSAWRATYTATCIDPPSLLAFIEDHYGKGPEQVCAQGKDPADPLTGVPACE